jgi:hypothetical protein
LWINGAPLAVSCTLAFSLCSSLLFYLLHIVIHIMDLEEEELMMVEEDLNMDIDIDMDGTARFCTVSVISSFTRPFLTTISSIARHR